MEKRIIIRIVFTALSLKDAAELEEKIETILKDYPEHGIDISALPSLPARK